MAACSLQPAAGAAQWPAQDGASAGPRWHAGRAQATLDVTPLAPGSVKKIADVPYGSDPAYWRALSPLLLVCSSLRSDSCLQAQTMAGHVQSLGGRAELLPEPLKHSQINAELGLESSYTQAVENFMASLDPVVAQHLQR